MSEGATDSPGLPRTDSIETEAALRRAQRSPTWGDCGEKPVAGGRRPSFHLLTGLGSRDRVRAADHLTTVTCFPHVTAPRSKQAA